MNADIRFPANLTDKFRPTALKKNYIYFILIFKKPSKIYRKSLKILFILERYKYF